LETRIEDWKRGLKIEMPISDVNAGQSSPNLQSPTNLQSSMCNLQSPINLQSSICNLQSPINLQSSICNLQSREAVLVVGAGPAGATAARVLARSGVTVRLLDRSKFPRNKPCGGGISIRALTRFPYLRQALGRITTHTVARLYLEGPGGESTVVESNEPAALMIRRLEFDNLLFSLAVEAGAEPVDGADIVKVSAGGDGAVLTARDGRRFEASIVIAADGVNSTIARRLGLNNGWPPRSVALDMMEETPRDVLRDLDPSTLWVAYGFDPGGRGASASRRGAAEGYAYVFPKRDHVNVGIGYVLAHYREAIDVAPYALQRGLVGHLKSRGVVEGESVRANFTPFHIPVGGRLPRVALGRVLLAGDAGGFVNGFTAEGIYYAMVSGDLAARSVLEAPQAVHTLARRYTRACDREIGADLRDSVLIQRYLFADRRRIARVIDGAQRDPAITRLILDFAVGRISYHRLRRRLLARAPLLAGRLLWERLRGLAMSGRVLDAGA
jgi:geranylgeranyl reductase family protein